MTTTTNRLEEQKRIPRGLTHRDWTDRLKRQGLLDPTHRACAEVLGATGYDICVALQPKSQEWEDESTRRRYPW